MSTDSIEARYTEHDKLGPLGATQPLLHDETRLRAALVAEFRAAATGAQHAVTELDDAGATKAVHASRKALRRARAVLSLVAGALSKADRRAIKDALQEARRGLSTPRDHAVAPDTLAKLPLGAEDRDAADRVLANATEAMPPVAEIEQLLKAAARHAAAQADALEAALPQTLAWEVVVDGVRAVYAEARACRRAAKRDADAFHAWRRRMKELTYQLEILGKHAGARVHQLHAEIDGIASAASDAVDLLMLRQFVETFAQGVEGDRRKHLDTAIGAALGDLTKSARRAGREAFDRSGKKFAKRLEKAVKKDLAPPTAPEHDSGDEHAAS